MYIYVNSKNIQQHLLQMIIYVLIRNTNQDTHNILKPHCVRQRASGIQKSPAQINCSSKYLSLFTHNKKGKEKPFAPYF